VPRAQNLPLGQSALLEHAVKLLHPPPAEQRVVPSVVV
jgi:hypothetical protein